MARALALAQRQQRSFQYRPFIHKFFNPQNVATAMMTFVPVTQETPILQTYHVSAATDWRQKTKQEFGGVLFRLCKS